jgi:hypothetical protein
MIKWLLWKDHVSTVFNTVMRFINVHHSAYFCGYNPWEPAGTYPYLPDVANDDDHFFYRI